MTPHRKKVFFHILSLIPGSALYFSLFKNKYEVCDKVSENPAIAFS